ncbi:hypothetical protein AALB39_04335 [Lachnospiraceae bacterium 54-53]
MKDKVLKLVSTICSEASTDCRSLNKTELARELMNLANIPEAAKIREVPVDWENQVIVLFTIPNDNNYYSLFGGITNDGQFLFELAITGIHNPETKYFDFLDKDKVLPIDYFCKKCNDSEEQIKVVSNNHIAQNYAAYELGINSPAEMLILLNILEAHNETLEDIANFTSHAVDNIFKRDITRKDIVEALMECNVFFDGENDEFLQDREPDFLENGLASGRIAKTTNGYVEINII